MIEQQQWHIEWSDRLARLNITLPGGQEHDDWRLVATLYGTYDQAHRFALSWLKQHPDLEERYLQARRRTWLSPGDHDDAGNKLTWVNRSRRAVV